MTKREAAQHAASRERRVERRCTSCGRLTLNPALCAACEAEQAAYEAEYERSDP